MPTNPKATASKAGKGGGRKAASAPQKRAGATKAPPPAKGAGKVKAAGKAAKAAPAPAKVARKTPAPAKGAGKAASAPQKRAGAAKAAPAAKGAGKVKAASKAAPAKAAAKGSKAAAKAATTRKARAGARAVADLAAGRKPAGKGAAAVKAAKAAAGAVKRAARQVAAAAVGSHVKRGRLSVTAAHGYSPGLARAELVNAGDVILDLVREDVPGARMHARKVEAKGWTPWETEIRITLPGGIPYAQLGDILAKVERDAGVSRAVDDRTLARLQLTHDNAGRSKPTSETEWTIGEITRWDVALARAVRELDPETPGSVASRYRNSKAFTLSIWLSSALANESGHV